MQVLRRQPRVRVARTRNAGAAATIAELLVFSDAHVAPSAAWLELLAEATRDPGVGAVGPTLTQLSGQAGAAQGLTWTNAALNLRWLGRGGDRPLPVDAVPLLHGDATRRLRPRRPLRRRFARYGGQDVELCVRLWRRGLKCLVDPRAGVAHRFRRASIDAAGVEDATYNLLRIASPTALVRQVLQTGLEVEPTEHLGYERHDPAGRAQATLVTARTPRR